MKQSDEKVLLYSKSLKLVNKSGIGEAVKHQKKALESVGVPILTEYAKDCTIVHLNTIFPTSLRMSKRAKKDGKKVVYYAHSTMEDFRNSFRGSNVVAPLYKVWIKNCYNSGDIIITPTDYSKKLLQNYGIKKPIISLSNGVDTNFFNKTQEARKRFRDKYNVKEDEKVIISVGHYIHRKGIIEFIDLAKQIPKYKFYWFGHTNLKLVPQSIKKALNNLSDNIYFPGYINRYELRDAYSGSDLFLFLTYEETEGIVLLEALSSEIPILIRDIPIYSKWLKEGETVYKGRTQLEFKEKIHDILNGKLPDLTSNGRALAMEKDLKAIGKELINIYNKQQ